MKAHKTTPDKQGKSHANIDLDQIWHKINNTDNTAERRQLEHIFLELLLLELAFSE